jgi:hypothetical protein
MNLYLNEEERIFDSIHLISHDSPTIYQLDPSSVVLYTDIWRGNLLFKYKRIKINFSIENHEVNSIEVFYSLYSGDLIEFISWRHSLSMKRSVENRLNFQLVPSKIEVNKQLNIPTEFSDLWIFNQWKIPSFFLFF